MLTTLNSKGLGLFAMLAVANGAAQRGRSKRSEIPEHDDGLEEARLPGPIGAEHQVCATAEPHSRGGEIAVRARFEIAQNQRCLTAAAGGRAVKNRGR